MVAAHSSGRSSRHSCRISPTRPSHDEACSQTPNGAHPHPSPSPLTITITLKVSPDIMEELSSPRRHLSHPFSAASKTLRANAAPATNAASQPAQTGSAPSTAASASPAKRNQGRAGSGKRKGGVSARRGSLPYQVIAAHLDHELSLPPCARYASTRLDLTWTMSSLCHKIGETCSC